MGGTYRTLYYCHDLLCECAFDFFKFATGEHHFGLGRRVSSKLYLPRIELHVHTHSTAADNVRHHSCLCPPPGLGDEKQHHRALGCQQCNPFFYFLVPHERTLTVRSILENRRVIFERTNENHVASKLVLVKPTDSGIPVRSTRYCHTDIEGFLHGSCPTNPDNVCTGSRGQFFSKLRVIH